MEDGFHLGVFVDFGVVLELGADPDGKKEFFLVVINHKWLLYLIFTIIYLAHALKLPFNFRNFTKVQ